MKQNTRKQRKEDEELFAATKIERAQVNGVLLSGKRAFITAAGSEYELDAVTDDWWYITHPKDQEANYLNRRSWCGCNDDTWADIMKQLGLERHLLFRG